jgi:hypothetical protein
MIAYLGIGTYEENAGEGPRAASSLAQTRSANRGPGLREALAIWVLLAAEVLAALVTYARLPPDVLYHTSVGGARGGFGRALVELNFPVAIVSLAILPVALNALLGWTRMVYAAVLVAIPTCALAAVVVHQKDLDARPINVVPAVGVLVIATLTALAIRREGLAPTPRASGDPLRVVLACLVLLIGIPWLFAIVGFYAPDPFYADEHSHGEKLAAVHLGSHHGLYGVVFALAGLGLSRALPAFRQPLLTACASVAMALALGYGLANAFQDFEVEQLWKRGTVGWKMQSVLYPGLTWGWAAILLVTALVELAWFRRERALRL